MDKELKQRMDKANEQMVVEASQEPAEGPQTSQPIDYYQAQQNSAYEASQSPTVHGSPAGLTKIVEKMVEDFKQSNYVADKDRYDYLTNNDARGPAETFRQNYLVSKFFPLVESIVENYSVDSLLNNPKALAELDSVAITPNGSGDGFTKGYIQQMHKGQLNNSPSQSDIEVKWQLMKARKMADDGDIRGGVSLAKRLKQKVDQGELSASEKDYETLMRASAYGN